jgi:hypothetical protein
VTAPTVLLAAVLVAQAAGSEVPPTATIGPEPEALGFTPAMTATASNFGVDAARFDRGTQIRASDPETLHQLVHQQKRRPCPGPYCPDRPEPKAPEGPDPERIVGPIKRVQEGVSAAIAVAGGAFLVICGLILATRNRSN